MNIKKKLFGIFGPIVIAVVLLLVLFFTPFKVDLESKAVLSEASTSMATNVLRGNAIKNKAIGSKEYVPFLVRLNLAELVRFIHRYLQKSMIGAIAPFY